MRMESRSPKDGVQSTLGDLAIRSTRDIILRLVTPGRERVPLFELFQGANNTFDIFFLPFNNCMASESKYPISCVPESLRNHGYQPVSIAQILEVCLQKRRGATSNLRVNITEVHRNTTGDFKRVEGR